MCIKTAIRFTLTLLAVSLISNIRAEPTDSEGFVSIFNGKDPPKKGKNPNDTYVKAAPSKDGDWFDYHIIVKGKTIELRTKRR